MEKKYNYNKSIFIITPIVYFAISVLVVLLIAKSGIWPNGDDTFYYIYRGNMIYKGLKSGTFYPLIDTMWYNGVQLVKCTSQLSPYVLAFCQMLAGGDIFNGYLIMVSLILFLGGIPWIIMGFKQNRPILGAFMGIYWFFMPSNIFALFKEGNIGRSLAMVGLPVLIYAVYSYLRKASVKKVIVITLSFAFIGLCHIGFAGMIAIVLIVFMLIYAISYRKYKTFLEIVIAIVLGAMMIGIWLVPYLLNGEKSVDSSETMASFFQNFFTTINPTERIVSDNTKFYFGLSCFILVIFGLLFSKKEEKPAFITTLIFLLLSSNSMYVVLKHLPGGQYLWMLRFFSITICLSFVAFVYWSTLRKAVVIVICILLAADVIPSMSLITGEKSGLSPKEILNQTEEYTLIDIAKENTSQRLALMDVATLSAKGAYLVSGYMDGVAATFGAGWEAATTATNIVQLNRAYEEGDFLYLFDRALELGNDTVLARKSQMNKYENSVEDLIRAATMNGYVVVSDNSDYILFKYKNIPADNFGIISEFNAIGIGENAALFSLSYPGLRETDNPYIDDYTFEELSAYELIYLDGFMYRDRKVAEELVLKLSRAGKKVVICADKIPEDRATHDQSFLGVRCNSIKFSNGYPELDTIEGLINADLFPQGSTEWQTVYLDGLTDTWGKLYDNDIELDFFGTYDNDNLVFVGINLPYFYRLTKDKSIGKLLTHAMNYDTNELPKRQLVPIKISFDGKKYVIQSDYDNVDTTIAYHKSFEADSDIKAINNLTYVNKGTTTIKVKMLHLVLGIIVTVIGTILFVVYCFIVKREKNGVKNNS